MRFVIIASPRTGSSHLVNMLGAHPQIWCHGNVFKPQAKRLPVFLPSGKLADDRADQLLELRKTDEVSFLEEVFRLDDGRPHVGFKIFEGQSDSVLNKLVNDKAVKKVVLYRDNVLANYSSTLAAQETGQWGAREDTLGPPPPVNFNRRDFIKFHNSYVAFYRDAVRALNEAGETFHWIDYTAVNDPLSMGALITFIGADGKIAISEENQRKQQVKQNSSNILSRFAKPKKVRDFLEQHNLLHWVHEGDRNLEPISKEPRAGSELETADEG